MSFFRLAAGAEKGGAPGLDQPFDGLAALFADFLLPAIHHKFHLKKARFPMAVEVVVHRGPAPADGPPEYAASLLEHPRPIGKAENPCRNGGMKPGCEHDFTGVNIADPRQDAPVQQEILEGPAAPPGHFCQPFRGDPAGKGLPAHLLQGKNRRARRKNQDPAETPHVLKGQGEAVFQGEKDVHVGAVAGGNAHEQPARHAQVDQQGDPAFEGENQVLPPPRQALQPAAGEPPGQLLGGRGLPQALVPGHNREKAPAH